MSSQKLDDNYAYKIIQKLKTSSSGRLHFRGLYNLGGFNALKLEKQLKIMVDENYLTENPGEKKRKYYMVTQDGNTYFDNEELRRRKIDEFVNTVERERQSKGFRQGIEQIIEAEGPRTRSCHMKIPFYLPRYKGSITIEWKLMSKDEQRRLRELSKLTPEEKARRKEEFWTRYIEKAGYKVRTVDGKLVVEPAKKPLESAENL